MNPKTISLLHFYLFLFLMNRSVSVEDASFAYDKSGNFGFEDSEERGLMNAVPRFPHPVMSFPDPFNSQFKDKPSSWSSKNLSENSIELKALLEETRREMEQRCISGPTEYEMMLMETRRDMELRRINGPTEYEIMLRKTWKDISREPVECEVLLERTRREMEQKCISKPIEKKKILEEEENLH